MLKIKKELNLIIIITFLCQNVVFGISERSSALRPPSHFSKPMEKFIETQNKQELKNVSHDIPAEEPIWTPAWNPLEALRDPDVLDVIRRLLSLRYKRQGLDTMIIDRTLEILQEHGNDPIIAQKAVYDQVIRFKTDSVFRKAYSRYHQDDKFKVTLQLFVPYLKLLRANKQSEVLIADVGCGNNMLGQALINWAPWLRVIGTEIQPRNPYVGKRLEFRKQLSPAKLPFKDAELDAVIIHAIQHHVFHEDWPLLLDELRRIVKPGGLVLLFEDSYSLLRTSHSDKEDTQLRDDFLALTEKQKRLYYAFSDWYSNVLVSENQMPFPFQFKSIEQLIEEAEKHGSFITYKAEFVWTHSLWFHQPPVGFVVMVRPFMPTSEQETSSLNTTELVALRQHTSQEEMRLEKQLADLRLITLSRVDQEAREWVDTFQTESPWLSSWRFDNWISQWLRNHEATSLDRFFQLTRLTYDDLKIQGIRTKEALLFLRRVLEEVNWRQSVPVEWLTWAFQEAFISEESALIAQDILRAYLSTTIGFNGRPDLEREQVLELVINQISNPIIRDRVKLAIYSNRLGIRAFVQPRPVRTCQ